MDGIETFATAVAVLILLVHERAATMAITGFTMHFFAKWMADRMGHRFTALLLQIGAATLFSALSFGLFAAGVLYGDTPFLLGALVTGVPVFWCARSIVSIARRRSGPWPPALADAEREIFRDDETPVPPVR